MQTVIRCRVSCQPICPHSIPRPRLCSASPARDGQATQSVSRRHRSLRCLAIATRGVLVPGCGDGPGDSPPSDRFNGTGLRDTRHSAHCRGRLWKASTARRPINKGDRPMQTHTPATRSSRPDQIVPGKYAKRARQANHPSKATRRIVMAALLAGLAAGSVATAQHAASAGYASAHHRTAAGSVSNVPWMY